VHPTLFANGWQDKLLVPRNAYEGQWTRAIPEWLGLVAGCAGSPASVGREAIATQNPCGDFECKWGFDSYCHSTNIANGNEGALAVNRSSFVLDASV
jgi:hypothetical protein